jgi:hypothetical protein
VSVTVGAGETADVGTIVVSRGRAVRGRVVTADGRPVAGASVFAGEFLLGDLGEQIDGMSGQRRAVSAADGSYSLRGLGTSALAIAADHPSLGRAPAVDLAAGQDDLVVDLTIEPTGAIEGRVTRGGEPMAAVVTALTDGGRDLQTVRTAPDGSYRFDRVAPGEYALQAQPLGGVIMIAKGAGSARAHPATVRSNEVARADIELGGGVTLTVTVRGGDGSEVGALISLLPGEHSAATVAELTALREAVGRTKVREAGMFIAGGAAMPTKFDGVGAGRYTACAVRMPEPDDSEGEVALLEIGQDAPVSCAPVEVKTTPAAQTVTLSAPAAP